MSGYGRRLDSFDDHCWSELLIDCGNLLDDVVPPADLYCDPRPSTQDALVAIDASRKRAASQTNEFAAEEECQKKRVRRDHCGGGRTKACRERMRREKLSERFAELSAVLEPGRPTKPDKLTLIGDAIRVINQLKAESQEYRETNEKLLEEIKTLKAEKNELREEKLVLKADKERMEQQSNTGFLPPHPAPIYPHMAGAQKMPMFPSYSFVPMWQYLSPSACDTSQDHHLRPPAA